MEGNVKKNDDVLIHSTKAGKLYIYLLSFLPEKNSGKCCSA